MIVKHPYARNEIRLDMAYLAGAWKPSQDLGDTFTSILHDLYDDFDLAKSTKDKIGLFFYDASEAVGIAKVIEALNDIFAEHGKELKEKQYLALTKWGFVEQAAFSVYEQMQMNDLKLSKAEL